MTIYIFFNDFFLQFSCFLFGISVQAVITDCPDGRNGMGWAGPATGLGRALKLGLVGSATCAGGGGHQTRVRKKSRKQTERRVGLAGATGEVQSGEEACRLYRQTVGLTEFQFSSSSSSLLLLSCFYCHRIIEAASKVESRQRRRRRHKSNSHRRS